MAHLSTTTCRLLARARREHGMTQSALAQAVGCKQSAISMLESGQPEKLSQEAVEKAAKLLGVALEEGAAPGPEPRPPSAAVARGFCPSALCPSNVPYAVGGELLFWPRLQPAGEASPRCACCGELLETRCPHCGAAVADGACCTACGGARVTNTLPPETPPDAWASQRRREIAEWRALLT
jgi:transcriptional regulator with XRE-family HTH domain